jgi:hypothetical protein
MMKRLVEHNKQCFGGQLLIMVGLGLVKLVERLVDLEQRLIGSLMGLMGVWLMGYSSTSFIVVVG